eukprot:CAMPEP_0178455810 /NCGR_PEP_ID=MMETSP0689_2-20121128/46109_1 /TAXON_ID=160604 /ORGANISM="Amphidinium massartii, Strain CS-259" /LENGTH=54 /DNA_ID=CAMNT_0020081873 /DNA_START=192 /DNA_END=353 /DNA_ORIENTATION=+
MTKATGAAGDVIKPTETAALPNACDPRRVAAGAPSKEATAALNAPLTAPAPADT